jgi:hypothetical protein
MEEILLANKVSIARAVLDGNRQIEYGIADMGEAGYNMIGSCCQQPGFHFSLKGGCLNRRILLEKSHILSTDSDQTSVLLGMRRMYISSNDRATTEAYIAGN